MMSVKKLPECFEEISWQLVGRIFDALGKKLDEQTARQHLGDMCWRVVRDFGGWHNLLDVDKCTLYRLMPEFRRDMLFVQARELEVSRLRLREDPLVQKLQAEIRAKAS